MPSEHNSASPPVVGEVARGEGICLAEAAAYFPADALRCVNPATVWRWAQKGVRAADGSRVRLEVARVGRRWLTSRAAVARFVAALNRQACEQTQAPPRARPKRRGPDVGEELARLGL